MDCWNTGSSYHITLLQQPYKRNKQLPLSFYPATNRQASVVAKMTSSGARMSSNSCSLGLILPDPEDVALSIPGKVPCSSRVFYWGAGPTEDKSMNRTTPGTLATGCSMTSEFSFHGMRVGGCGSLNVIGPHNLVGSGNETNKITKVYLKMGGEH